MRRVVYDGISLADAARQRQAADHRQADRRGDGRHRARQSTTQGNLAKRFWPAGARQAPLGRADRRDRHDRAGRCREPLEGNPGPRLRILLTQFASAEGKNGGQFDTPRCVVRVLVERLAPYNGSVYDPCCGSAGMFVQSEKFAEAHGGNKTDVSIFGQKSNPTTWRLAHMNLAIHSIEANLGPLAHRHRVDRKILVNSVQ